MRGAQADNPAIRISLANLLSTADLIPPGVSPSSLLIVREFGDPLPGRVMPSRFSTRIDLSWERAVRNSLARIYRQAVRPERGYIPANAKAVLFADESEMLACLALDLIRRTAADHWWWKMIVRSPRLASAGAAVSLFCQEARQVPAILHKFHDWAMAVEVLETVAPDQAMEILSAVTRVYGALEVWTILSEPPSSSPASYEDRRGTHQHHVVSEAAAARDGIRAIGNNAAAQATWNSWLLPGAAANIVRENACLLGIGLSLYSRPAEVKTSAFLRALRIWWQSQPNSLEPRQSVEKDKTSRKPSSPINNEISSGIALKGIRPTLLYRDPAAERIDADNHNSVEPAAQTLPQSKFISRQNPDTPSTISGKSSARNPSLQYGSASFRAVHRQEPAENSLEFEEGVATRLGGILYLINLMHRLDLPACFEEDWGLAGQVGSWGLLDILARGFLYPTHEIFLADPIWQVLAQLDGRPAGSLPGERFNGGSRFS